MVGLPASRGKVAVAWPWPVCPRGASCACEADDLSTHGEPGGGQLGGRDKTIRTICDRRHRRPDPACPKSRCDLGAHAELLRPVAQRALPPEVGGIGMLVLGKREAPGLAAALGANPQEAGLARNVQIFSSLLRPSRPQREMARAPLAGPMPTRDGDGLARKVGRRPHASIAEKHTLSASEAGGRITVRCSCGCYSLTAHKPAEPHDGLVRCLICGARAGLADLLAEWRCRRDHRSDTE